MIHRIRTRVIAVVCLLAAIAVAGVVAVQFAVTDELRALLHDRRIDIEAWTDRVLKLNGKSLEAMAYDYSYWDEMVDFLGKSDSAWALDNISASLGTYNANVVWLVQLDGSLHHLSTDENCPLLTAEIAANLISVRTLGAEPFRHFFTTIPDGLLEIRTAPIQPSSDIERKTTPRGYLLVGRIWNRACLDNLESLLEAKLELCSPQSDSALTSAANEDIRAGILRTGYVLRDMDGKPLAVLMSLTKTPMISEVAHESDRTVYSVALLAGLFLISLWFAITRWVVRPLGHVSSALQGVEPESLAHLHSSGAEFSEIGTLISRYSASERALQESQRSLQTLFSNLPGMAYRCANDNYWTMEMVSDGCTDLTGYQVSDLTDNRQVSFGELIVADDRKMVWDSVQAALDLHRPFHLLYGIRHRDGTIRFVEEHGRGVFDNEDKLLALEGFIADITERRKAESEQAELRAQLETARRLESLGILAGGVAHDLNNMLGPLVAYPEMILESLPPDSNVRDSVAQLGRSAEMAANVIQDLLTLARRGRYKMCATDVNEIVTSYISSPSFQMLKGKHQNVLVHTVLEENLPAINGSATHLFKVLMNLVVNAFDAMSDGGVLRMTTGRRILTEAPAGNESLAAGEYVVLSISDTGAGIAEADRARIFEPYFSTKKMGGSGTGLGLAIVHGIVKDHNGAVLIMSEVGHGTAMEIFLPVTTCPTRTVAEANESLLGTGHILIVDDMAEQRALASHLLTSLGYTTGSVSTGTAATEYVARHKVDLVVLDMLLEPEMDGLDALREIRRAQPDVAVVLVSGYAATERVHLALEAGASSLVPKPFTRDTLGRAVLAARRGQHQPTVQV